MNRDQLRAIVIDALLGVAPDIDPHTLDDRASLRDEYDLDSMDALNLATALHKRLHVSIPETEFARLQTVEDLVAWLQVRLRANGIP